MSAHPNTVVEVWNHRLEQNPDGVALRYFDRTFTAAELDLIASQTAATLSQRGVSKRDVVGIALQNCPQFMTTVLALWKLGATALLINPMYRKQELTHLLSDAGAVGVIHDSRLRGQVLPETDRLGIWAISTSSHRLQTRNDERVLGREAPPHPVDLLDLGEQASPLAPQHIAVIPSDCAFLTYTSGTTGPAKGAINTHGAVLAAATAFAEVAGVTSRDRVLAMAPMFHITGAVINAVLALVSGATLVMIERFHPDAVVDAIDEHEVTFTVASITAYLSLASSPGANPTRLSSIRALYSGGAPVPSATVDDLQQRLGHYIHNVYGLTETTSAVIAVPCGTRAPVDPTTGALSVGRPLPGTSVRVLGEHGESARPGIEGELEIRGPSVVPGYWRQPEASAAALPDGALRTGDVAVVDDEGWVFIVDRLKDQINTSGYKVWPNEVEQILLRHPDVERAAVVGQSDSYRGEVVTAYVVAAAGRVPVPDELIAFAREHLASYKAPRKLQVVDELPTTSSGKIQRRLLRDN